VKTRWLVRQTSNESASTNFAQVELLCHLKFGPFGIRTLCSNFPWPRIVLVADLFGARHLEASTKTAIGSVIISIMSVFLRFRNNLGLFGAVACHGVFNMAELIAGHLLTRNKRANGQLYPKSECLRWRKGGSRFLELKASGRPAIKRQPETILVRCRSFQRRDH
jgi:hypothetical protein